MSMKHTSISKSRSFTTAYHPILEVLRCLELKSGKHLGWCFWLTCEPRRLNAQCAYGTSANTPMRKVPAWGFECVELYREQLGNDLHECTS